MVLAVLAVLAGTLYWLHIRQFESTDDAQVDGHLNAISPRVEGTIIKVYVDDNQIVKAGDPLVDLGSARLSSSGRRRRRRKWRKRRVWCVRSNRTCRLRAVQNSTNISGSEADLDNAQAALATAQRDVETAKARAARSAGEQR